MHAHIDRHRVCEKGHVCCVPVEVACGWEGDERKRQVKGIIFPRCKWMSGCMWEGEICYLNRCGKEGHAIMKGVCGAHCYCVFSSNANYSMKMFVVPSSVDDHALNGSSG